MDNDVLKQVLITGGTSGIGLAIAQAFDISKAAIGLSIIAIGTSLPELATTLSEALRGHCAIAIGNVLGSNLFNILAIMGVTALVADVPVCSYLSGGLDSTLITSLAAREAPDLDTFTVRFEGQDAYDYARSLIVTSYRNGLIRSTTTVIVHADMMMRRRSMSLAK